MERDANYLAVGAFVLIAVALAAVFLVWYSDRTDGREYELYEIYFTGSVSGLTRGGPVRYLGVDVGRVRRLEIDPEDPARVRVVVEVDTSAPIDSATRASLGLQGVTGLLYIDLKQAPNAPAGLPLPEGEVYPVIPSVASDFDVFVSSLPELVSRATTLVDRLNLLISDENVTALSTTFENLRETTDSLPETSKDIGALISDLRATLREVDGIARELRGALSDARPEVQGILERFASAAENFADASRQLESFIAETETHVGRFTEQGLFELEQLLRDSRAAAAEFRELTRSLREEPSRLLYEPPIEGVEIEP